MPLDWDFNVKVVRMLTVSLFWLLLGFFLPFMATAEDSAQEKPKAGSNAVEQSPIEAAGGLQNFIRIRKACEEDSKRLCSDLKAGGGRLLQCLRGHESNLSTTCSQTLGPHPANGK